MICFTATGVAQAAAEFLNFKMIDGPEEQEDGSETPARGRGKKSGDTSTLNHRKLRTVVQFFHESEVRTTSRI